MTLTPEQWGTRIKPIDINGSSKVSSNLGSSRDPRLPPSRRMSQAHRENEMYEMDYPSTERQEYSSANANKFTLGKETEDIDEQQRVRFQYQAGAITYDQVPQRLDGTLKRQNIQRLTEITNSNPQIKKSMNYPNPIIEKLKIGDEKPSIEQIRRSIVENTHVWQKLHESDLLDNEEKSQLVKNQQARNMMRSKSQKRTTVGGLSSKKSLYESGATSSITSSSASIAKKISNSVTKRRKSKSKSSSKKKSPSPIRQQYKYDVDDEDEDENQVNYKRARNKHKRKSSISSQKGFQNQASTSNNLDVYEEKEEQLKGEISSLRDRLKHFYHNNKLPKSQQASRSPSSHSPQKLKDKNSQKNLSTKAATSLIAKRASSSQAKGSYVSQFEKKKKHVKQKGSGSNLAEQFYGGGISNKSTKDKKVKGDGEYASGNEIEHILKRRKSSISGSGSKIMETALRKAEEKFNQDYERLKDVYKEECTQLRDNNLQRSQSGVKLSGRKKSVC